MQDMLTHVETWRQLRGAVTRSLPAATALLTVTTNTALSIPSIICADAPAPPPGDTIDQRGVYLTTDLPFFSLEEGGSGPRELNNGLNLNEEQAK